MFSKSRQTILIKITNTKRLNTERCARMPSETNSNNRNLFVQLDLLSVLKVMYFEITLDPRNSPFEFLFTICISILKLLKVT